MVVTWWIVVFLRSVSGCIDILYWCQCVAFYLCISQCSKSLHSSSLMVGHGGSSAGSYLADPTSPIPSHCASIVATITVRVNIICARRWVIS